jgi:hypothetical protein
MPSIFTDFQILLLEGMRTPPFGHTATVLIEERRHSSSARDNSAYRHPCNVPSFMDKGTGQGEYPLVEVSMGE